MSDAHEQVICILRATQDGDNLAPEHLKLVELVINGHANQRGMAAFGELYANVIAGDYRPPWFHGIEHLTHDQEGYVLWKGVTVEHYSPRYAYSKEARRAARVTAARCRYLEERRLDVDVHTVVWRWDEDHRDAYLESRGCVWSDCHEIRCQALSRKDPAAIFGRVYSDSAGTGQYQIQLARKPFALRNIDGTCEDYRGMDEISSLAGARAQLKDFAEHCLANPRHCKTWPRS